MFTQAQHNTRVGGSAEIQVASFQHQARYVTDVFAGTHFTGSML